jgi:hypothetical protein
MVLLVVPALLAGPLLLLAAAVVDLGGRGPLGWLAAAALLAAVWVATSWCARRTAAWWRTTRAPDLVLPPPRQIRHKE